MTQAQASMPATRGDLKDSTNMLRGELRSAENVLRGELKATENVLREEIKTTENVLREEIKTTANVLREEIKTTANVLRGEIQASVHRLANEITRTQADVRDIRHTMEGLATKKDVDRIIGAIDVFAGKAQNYDRAAALHGHSLTDLEVKVKDHEGRIKNLESGRS